MGFLLLGHSKSPQAQWGFTLCLWLPSGSSQLATANTQSVSLSLRQNAALPHDRRSFRSTFRPDLSLTGAVYGSGPPAPGESIGAPIHVGRARNRRRRRKRPRRRLSIGRPPTGLFCPRRQQRSYSPRRAESNGTGRDV